MLIITINFEREIGRINLVLKDKNMVLEDVFKFEDSNIKDIFNIDLSELSDNMLYNDLINDKLTIKEFLNIDVLIRFIDKGVISVETTEQYGLTDEEYENAYKQLLIFMKSTLLEVEYKNIYTKKELIKIIKNYKFNQKYK